MNTRLLIRPVSDIRINSIEDFGGYLTLSVDNLNSLPIETFSVLSLDFNDKITNPSYNGSFAVIFADVDNNRIQVNKLWINDTDFVGGYIRNILNPDGLSERFRTEEFDLDEDLQFPLTYKISDIREPQNRKSDFSKTITIPGTAKNNKIMSELFEINSDSVYDVNLRKDIIAIQSGLEIFKGYCKLENVKRIDWQRVEYEIKLSGQIADVFSRLKNGLGEDLSLQDLDFSEYDHFLNYRTIPDSWIGQIKLNSATYSNFATSSVVNILGITSSNSFTTFVIDGSSLMSPVSPYEIYDTVRFELDNPENSFPELEGHHTVVANEINGLNPWTLVNLDFNQNWDGSSVTGTMSRYSSKGEGYVYPVMDLGIQYTLYNMRLEDYIVHFYVKDVLTKIMKYIGFTIDSDFVNSEYFKRLIITGKPYDPSKNNFYGENNSTTKFLLNSNYQPSNSFSNCTIRQIDVTPVNDEDGAWSGTDFYENVQSYNVETKFYIKSLYNFQSSDGSVPSSTVEFGTNFATSGTKLYIGFARSLNADGTNNLNWSDSFFSGAGANFFARGNVQDDSGAVMLYGVFSSDNPPADWNETTLQGTLNVDTPIMVLRPGEKVKAFVLTFKTQNYFNQSWYLQQTKVWNNGFSLSSGLPDLKAKDFLVSLITMHNLYMEPDRNNNRKIIIEPFNDYYKLDSTALNLTKKVDLNKDVNFVPVSPDTPLNFKYKYADDGDYLNKVYKDAHIETYGTYETSGKTEFNTNTQTIEVKIPQSVISDRIFDNRRLAVPTIIKDKDYNKMDSFKPRISYFTGLRYAGFFLNLATPFSIEDRGTNYYFGRPMFGYAGHFDNPLCATIDLDFGINQEYYYGSGFRVTENTLFERFYRDYFEEVTDKNTRLLRCYLKLNAYDISTLSFRRIYEINRNLYRLQQISDYDPLKNDPVKAEFIKVKQAPKYTATKKIKPPVLTSRIIKPHLLDTLVALNGRIGLNHYIRNNNNPGLAVGQDSTVHENVTRYYINGIGNVIGTASSDVSLSGPYNFVGEENRNVSLFGTGNITRNYVINSNIAGNGNEAGTYSSFLDLRGSGNYIGMSSSFVKIMGSNNIVGNDVTNINVFGSNMYITQSNANYMRNDLVLYDSCIRLEAATASNAYWAVIQSSGNIATASVGSTFSVYLNTYVLGATAGVLTGDALIDGSSFTGFVGLTWSGPQDVDVYDRISGQLLSSPYNITLPIIESSTNKAPYTFVFNSPGTYSFTGIGSDLDFYDTVYVPGTGYVQYNYPITAV